MAEKIKKRIKNVKFFDLLWIFLLLKCIFRYSYSLPPPLIFFRGEGKLQYSHIGYLIVYPLPLKKYKKKSIQKYANFGKVINKQYNFDNFNVNFSFPLSIKMAFIANPAVL